MVPDSRVILRAERSLIVQPGAALPDAALTKSALAPRALAAQAAARFRATGDLSDFLVATVLDAFLLVKLDEAQLDECRATILDNPVMFNTGFQYGWVLGVIEVIAKTLEGYKTMFAEFEAFLEDSREFYKDYWSALTDLETLTKIVLAIKDSSDHSLEETIQQIYSAVTGKHSDLAIIMLDVLDRLNRMSAVIRIFEEKTSEQIVRGIIADLGPTLAQYWQSDINRYLALRRQAWSLGQEIGKDYGRLGAEVTLMVIGV